MPTVKYTPNPSKSHDLTPAQRNRLDGMTDGQITAAALSDPDNQPLTEEELLTITAQRLVKLNREKLGMTQEQFATVYHINKGRLRDIEQCRGTRGDSALVAYLRVIKAAPDTVRKILEDQGGNEIPGYSGLAVDSGRLDG